MGALAATFVGHDGLHESEGRMWHNVTVTTSKYNSSR